MRTRSPPYTAEIADRVLDELMSGRPLQARSGVSSDKAEFIKQLNGRSRGLPSEDQPLDEQ
jgi:hypothetical protein